MHKNDYGQQQEKENRLNNKVQQDFEDAMEDMIMDLRFFIC